MKIVADTNIIISMLLWGKSLERLFTLINNKQVTLCFSPNTIDELFRVLHYPKILKQSQKLKIDVEPLVDKLLSASIISYPAGKINLIKDDPSDNLILETAKTAKSECIISGDKHLLNLKNFENIPIYSPSQFIKLFLFS